MHAVSLALRERYARSARGPSVRAGTARSAHAVAVPSLGVHSWSSKRACHAESRPARARAAADGAGTPDWRTVVAASSTRAPRGARPSSQQHQCFLSRGCRGGGGTHPLIKNSYYVHLKGKYTVSGHIWLACTHAAQARDHRHRSESRTACFTRQIARPHLAVHTGTTILLRNPPTADRDGLLQAGFDHHRKELKGRPVRSCPCYASRKAGGRSALGSERMPLIPARQPDAWRVVRAPMHREISDVRPNIGILPVPSTVSARR